MFSWQLELEISSQRDAVEIINDHVIDRSLTLYYSLNMM